MSVTFSARASASVCVADTRHAGVFQPGPRWATTAARGTARRSSLRPSPAPWPSPPTACWTRSRSGSARRSEALREQLSALPFVAAIATAAAVACDVMWWDLSADGPCPHRRAPPPLRPQAYKSNIFTINETGLSGIPHIRADGSGHKDFGPIIRRALELPGFTDAAVAAFPAKKDVTVGFGHKAVLSVAPQVVEAIQVGKRGRESVTGARVHVLHAPVSAGARVFGLCVGTCALQSSLLAHAPARLLCCRPRSTGRQAGAHFPGGRLRRLRAAAQVLLQVSKAQHER